MDRRGKAASAEFTGIYKEEFLQCLLVAPRLQSLRVEIPTNLDALAYKFRFNCLADSKCQVHKLEINLNTEITHEALSFVERQENLKSLTVSDETFGLTDDLTSLANIVGRKLDQLQEIDFELSSLLRHEPSLRLIKLRIETFKNLSLTKFYFLPEDGPTLIDKSELAAEVLSAIIVKGQEVLTLLRLRCLRAAMLVNVQRCTNLKELHLELDDTPFPGFKSFGPVLKAGLQRLDLECSDPIGAQELRSLQSIEAPELVLVTLLGSPCSENRNYDECRSRVQLNNFLLCADGENLRYQNCSACRPFELLEGFFIPEF